MAAVHDVLHVDQAAKSQVSRDPHRVVNDVIELFAVETLRRVDGIRVAGVDTRPLDVLHHASEIASTSTSIPWRYLSTRTWPRGIAPIAQTM